MLELESIVSNFETLVRLNQAENPEGAQLSALLTDPTGDGTARLAYHPILTSENLDAITPDYNNYNYPAWSDGAYATGSVVSRTDSYYVATEAIIAGEEPGISAKWLKQGKLDSYLQERRREAIRNAIITTYNNKKVGGQTRETMGDTMLYEGAGRMQDLIIKRAGRLVGFSIQLLNNAGLEVLLRRISLQLTSAQALNIYVWHNSQEDPIATIAITHNKVNSVEWHDVPIANQSLKFKDIANDQDSGMFYVGYYEDDLTGQAVKKLFTFGQMPCSTCNSNNVNSYKKYSQYVKIRTFSVNNPPAAQKLWDLNDMAEQVDTNWGMNFTLSTRCNITDYLIERRLAFADVIAEQLKYDLILEIANSSRSNVLTESIQKKARGVLQREDLGGEGLRQSLDRSLKSASVEMADITANVCMPKQPSRGVKSSSISAW